MSFNNICIYGNDKRMEYVESWLYSCGYECDTDLEHMNENTILITSPPVNINVFNEIKTKLQPKQLFIGGAIKADVINELKKMNIRYYDYLKWENVVEENALLTAKGIIQEATSLNIYIEQSNCLVSGYGYCAKAIAKEIKNKGGKVDIIARNTSLKDEILSNGYEFINLNNYSNVNMDKYSYVFNTIPALVINSKMIEKFSDNVMIFDIASFPGGVDFEYCKNNNIFTRHSLGIPGKLYPKEAGTIIAKAIVNKIL